ncbi:AAA family ATPase [Psychrobacillus sp. MER TA 171]|uniref:McrB family protein n=1 Tax=Psychrobacillus sp. MER TA 171 TaxID=2939577 RepID=UPI00203D0888|nr:AAA family ATPase [Psychrobacillus sp. MER TA 171]MCM3359244.1 AAA family ATPase [Psychrobacillus sp. MER TA 171]
MNSIVLNPELLNNNDITKYLHSFTKFHSWLLEDDYSFNEESFLATKDVLDFIRSGVKIKKKKILKLYFEQFDIDSIKQFISPLSDVLEANTNDDISLALSKKSELISLGILNFTKQYIEQISQYNPPFIETESSAQQTQFELKNDEQIIQQNRQRIIKQKSQYTKWLEGGIVPTLEKLKEEYDNHNISEELVRNFVKEFRKFVGGKLVFQITDVNEKTVSGIPLEISNSGYEEMKHPFLNITWEVSAPIVKNIKYKAGDIVEASFNETRNENFRYLLLFVDFGRATVLPRSILDVLATNLKPTVLKDVLINLNVAEENDEQIQAYVIQKVLERSDLVKQELNKSLEELEEKFTQLQSKEKELGQQEHELNEQEKQWKTILDRIDYYKRFEQFKTVGDEEVYNEIPFNPQLFVEQLQSLFYFNDELQLVYSKEIIRSFVYALQSNILSVLAGPSGTGKSSIVHAFANAVENVEVRMIPVQSSWTDTQDLLGYFHPTDKAFVPTPFMEAMAEAAHKDNAHKIFLICLDEMNLAHVEYYFSEILSAREEKKQEIRLYPKRHWETAKLILEQGQVDIERLQSARDLIEKYPPVFSIPSNVRFIGTLNMDHTVKPLSPKVIDRSFIIEISHLSASEKREIISSLEVLQGKVKLNYDKFIETYSEEVVLEAYIDELQDISNLFEGFPNASLNSRGIKHLTKILTYCKDSSEIEKFLDYLIYGKILPRLEIKKSEFVLVENSIMSQLEKYEKSYIKLQKMIEAKHTITFW